MTRINSSTPLSSLSQCMERWGTRSVVSSNVIGSRDSLHGFRTLFISCGGGGQHLSLSRPWNRDGVRRVLLRREITSSLLGRHACSRSGVSLSSVGMGTGIRASSRPSPSIFTSERNLVTRSGSRATAAATGGEEDIGVEAAVELTPLDHLNDKEKAIFEKLQQALKPIRLEVKDISGGCGSMYWIDITSDRFRGLAMLKQQRMVNEVLKEEVKSWHGMQLKTGVP